MFIIRALFCHMTHRFHIILSHGNTYRSSTVIANITSTERRVHLSTTILGSRTSPNKGTLSPPRNPPQQQNNGLIRVNTGTTGISGPRTWVPWVSNRTGETAPAKKFKQSPAGADKPPLAEEPSKNRSKNTSPSSNMCKPFDSNRRNFERKIYRPPEQNETFPNRAQSS